MIGFPSWSTASLVTALVTDRLPTSKTFLTATTPISSSGPPTVAVSMISGGLSLVRLGGGALRTPRKPVDLGRVVAGDQRSSGRRTRSTGWPALVQVS